MKKFAISVLILVLIASMLSIVSADSHPGIPHDDDGVIYAEVRTNTVKQLSGYGGVNSHTRAYNTKLKCSLCGYYWTYIYQPEPHSFRQVSYTYVSPHLIVYTDKCGACGRTRTRTVYK